MVSNKVNTVLNFVIIVVGHLWPAIKTITTLKVSGYSPLLFLTLFSHPIVAGLMECNEKKTVEENTAV